MWLSVVVIRSPIGSCADPSFSEHARHVYVTQNGDWPAQSSDSEYRFFWCDGLVCTNPQFFEQNKDRWRSTLIPNGVNTQIYTPGPSSRPEFGLPGDRLIVLMVSALIASKRVGTGVEAVSRIPTAHLLVAGDGPLRHTIEAEAARPCPVGLRALRFLQRKCRLFTDRRTSFFTFQRTNRRPSLSLRRWHADSPLLLTMRRKCVGLRVTTNFCLTPKIHSTSRTKLCAHIMLVRCCCGSGWKRCRTSHGRNSRSATKNSCETSPLHSNDHYPEPVSR